ncbi:hypothetical protein C8C83_3712 [Flavobacterium sp. 90]|uniref:hypothetical protein n=1 Tax=unclassified Flavobacterium TaxID=196869 RepID=UPI000EACD3CC|nr:MULTISPECIES: hypothetical protein [unclassified Flavobacterium]RKR11953.1 hypothetical protein C8C82_4031 [Flavobacterium sp. 81]TCK55727.1 hypothetical protein C8C83_3712 [Flavobacterium sp. 90]
MDWRFNSIWFEQLEQDKIFRKDFKENTITSENKNFTTSEYAIIWHLKEKSYSFENLSEADKLLYLELNWANIKNFDGIEKFKNLKRLELHYCTKLENDHGLSLLSENLEFLHINTSKKFKLSQELLQLKKLKVLCLNNCGPIDNLDFLNEFPNLIDFRFVNTNILNGNLKPILDHPTIRSVGFLNKRHYNYKDEQLKKELENKFENEYKTYVHKGDFLTYRYDYE